MIYNNTKKTLYFKILTSAYYFRLKISYEKYLHFQNKNLFGKQFFINCLLFYNNLMFKITKYKLNCLIFSVSKLSCI